MGKIKTWTTKHGKLIVYAYFYSAQQLKISSYNMHLALSAWMWIPSRRSLSWLSPPLSSVSPPPVWLALLPRAYGFPPAAASVVAPRPAAEVHKAEITTSHRSPSREWSGWVCLLWIYKKISAYICVVNGS